MVGDGPLQIIDFGPTKIKMLPESIINRYEKIRYRTADYCEFPYNKHKDEGLIIASEGESLPRRSSQLYEALGKWYIPIKTREQWLSQVGTISGSVLSRQIPNLNFTEVDNTISSDDACRDMMRLGTALRVVEFNAESGKHWKEFSEMVKTDGRLQNADIILLNEMDIGMARSGNTHTTRKLAMTLGMNYAWGLEFVELTNGNRIEQNVTKSMKNALGLHGNAILSKCKLFDPIIIRDPLDEVFFSRKPAHENDVGHEIRLGGRMGLFAKTQMGDEANPDEIPIVVGSVHKVNPSNHRATLSKYFQSNPPQAILVSGDVDRSFCIEAQLKNVGSPRKKTWPANCANGHVGRTRGDIFCGRHVMAPFPDHVVMPCHPAPAKGGSNNSGTILQISDHGIISIDLVIR